MQPSEFCDQLMTRVDKLQAEVAKLQDERRVIERKISEAEAKLKIWRDALQVEEGRLGKPDLPLFSKPNQPYRFAGLKLIEAVDLLRNEQPGITKKQLREMLEQNNFDFKGKRPGTAIHFVWIALERRRKKNQQQRVGE